MKYFTSDLHFGNDSYTILRREFRPFASPIEYMDYQVKVFNEMMT